MNAQIDPADMAKSSTRPTAIVVGAGFGGISLAIRLQAMGFQTTLLDNRDKPGGRAYVYEMGGFKFDGGPTVITDPDCLRELLIRISSKSRSDRAIPMMWKATASSSLIRKSFTAKAMRSL